MDVPQDVDEDVNADVPGWMSHPWKHSKSGWMGL